MGWVGGGGRRGAQASARQVIPGSGQLLFWRSRLLVPPQNPRIAPTPAPATARRMAARRSLPALAALAAKSARAPGAAPSRLLHAAAAGAAAATAEPAANAKVGAHWARARGGGGAAADRVSTLRGSQVPRACALMAWRGWGRGAAIWGGGGGIAPAARGAVPPSARAHSPPTSCPTPPVSSPGPSSPWALRQPAS